jgi:hypothetical protein
MILTTVGCESSSYLQKGAALGALGGAGLGALIGHASHNTAAGALIGAGAGAVAGGATGAVMDNSEKRAEAAAAREAEIDHGGATTTDVLAMTREGVDPQLIINYVNSAGMEQPLTTQDIIYLRDHGVSYQVVEAMRIAPVVSMPPGYVRVPPPRTAVIVEGDPYGPCCYPRYGCGYGYYGCRCR